MRFLEHIRYYSFWILDFLKGSKIKRHLKEITFINENWQHADAQIIQKKHLYTILRHAIETSPYYKHLSQETPLHEFPIINKNSIREHYDQFPSITYANKSNNRTVSTSGSTGIPLKIVQNKNKINRNTADTIYFSKLAGFKIGYKLYFLRHWNTTYKKSKLKNWLQNIKPLEVVNLSDMKIEKLIKTLKNDSSKKALLGFPSGFEQICKYLDRTNSKPIKSQVKSIIGMAEGLNSYTKERMSHYFNTPMVSRYSNMENGILAQQTAQSGNEFIINWASYYIEILNTDDNQPAPKGTFGRIVVTDLFNYTMPLIRYDTGDLGLINHECSPPTLLRIEGRTTDTIYNTKGDIVSSFIMTSIINFKGLKQLQLIQKDKKTYQLKMNVEDHFKETEVLKTHFKNILGADAQIMVKYTTETAVLNSGKRRITRNDMP
jgi:phenylacetate-CoA ligase